MIRLRGAIGICEVYDLTESRYKLSDDSPDSVLFVINVDGIWRNFRDMVVGYTDACPCTATDAVIPWEEGKGGIRLVEEKFIRTLENIIDSRMFVPGYMDDMSGSIARRNLLDTTNEMGNIIYLGRFLDLTMGSNGMDKIQYESLVKYRVQKSELVRYYNSQLYEISNKDRMESYVKSSNDIAKTTAESVATIGDYAEKSYKLAVETQKMSKWASATAVASILISIVTVIVDIVMS